MLKNLGKVEKRLVIYGLIPQIETKLTYKAIRQRHNKKWKGLYRTLSKIKKIRMKVFS